MPGICGIIASRNRVNLKHEFDAMFGSMRRYNHEKSQKHESDTACFGMVSLASAIKRNPAEKIISNSDSIFLSSNPQLDDHRAILDLLENNVQATQEPTEAELLRALDWQTNPDLLARAYGNWSFAQYSFTTKKLSLAREPYGSSELYYIQTSKYFAFSSSLTALLALPGLSCRPSERDLALLVLHTDKERDSDDNSTPFKGVQRLLAGCYLSFDGVNSKLARYWSMYDSIPEHTLSATDTIDHANQLLQTAVKRASNKLSNIGTTLSSGLDSSIVSAMAAGTAMKSGQAISAYCSVPRFPNESLSPKHRFADESPYAKLLADRYSNLELIIVPADDMTPLEGLTQSIECNPLRGTYTGTNDYWFHSLFSAAKSRDATRILHGQIGNLTLSYDASIAHAPLVQLFKNRRWRKLLSRIAHQRQIAVLRNFLALNTRNRIQNQQVRLTSPINPALYEHLDLQSLPGADVFNKSASTEDERLKYLDPNAGHSDGWTEMSAMYGLDCADPTADTAFTLFTLSIDPKFFLGPDLSNKHLARSIGEGLLPAETLALTSRGYQAADFGARLLHDAAKMEETFAIFRNDKEVSRFLNLDEMYLCWESLQTNRNPLTERRAWRYLFFGVAFGKFLKRWVI